MAQKYFATYQYHPINKNNRLVTTQLGTFVINTFKYFIKNVHLPYAAFKSILKLTMQLGDGHTSKRNNNEGHLAGYVMS